MSKVVNNLASLQNEPKPIKKKSAEGNKNWSWHADIGSKRAYFGNNKDSH